MKVTQSCLTLCNPMTQSMEFSRPEYWSGWPFSSPGHLPNPGIESRSPTLQANSLPTEPPGRPKNPEVGSLSILQQIFRTQELNWGLRHCRQILYQLSYQGSPAAAAAAKSLHSCPTLCDPIDGSPPGSSVPGILQARTLEWVAISFSSA